MLGLKETLKKVFRPVEAERSPAHEFVNRYEKIKPQLELMGAVLKDVGYRDFDDKRITIFMVTCHQAQANVVKSLLDQAKITDVTATINNQDESESRWLSLRGYMDKLEERRSFIIYKGKHMNPFDVKKITGC